MAEEKVVSRGRNMAPIIISIFALLFSWSADNRAEKLFEAQRISSIQVVPLKFEPYHYGNEQMGRVELQILNYTGFKAKDLYTDVRFEDTGWIREWIMATVKGFEEIEKKRELTGEERALYTQCKASLADNAGDIEKNKFIRQGWQGAIVLPEKGKEKTVMVRAKWTSENGAIFDKIFYFSLVRTGSGTGGDSYTMIPKDNFSKN